VSTRFITPTARRDIDSIWQYIARDSIRHADMVEAAIHADMVEAAIAATCFAVAQMPGLGHRRAGVRRPNVLFLTVSGYERYSIAYLADSEPLRVLRVVHGARDVPELFE
jgi:plasmid stabilization system protein ParE